MALCGLGHVLSSIVIGFIGIAAGIAVSGIEKVEGTRGNIAAWLLLLFGAGYMIWGLYRLWKGHPHEHDHAVSDKKRMTFWILFTIFIFGPCEPLIPILMYPAAQHNYGAVVYISLLFAITTIATMIAVVLLMLKGISLVKFNKLDRYQHVLAGAAITLCGVAIVFLGSLTYSSKSVFLSVFFPDINCFSSSLFILEASVGVVFLLFLPGSVPFLPDCKIFQWPLPYFRY